jgi:aminotransferase
VLTEARASSALGRPSARLSTIPASPIRRIFDRAHELEEGGAHVYHLEIGRPDFDTPDHIKRAAIDALDAGFVHYSSNWGIPRLRQAIAQKLARDNGLAYSPDDEIIVTVGANEAVLLAMLAFLDPGDEIIIPIPAWPHYAQCARLAGAVPVAVSLSPDDGYQVEPSQIAPLITRRTRMVVVCTPHNPTGAVVDRAHLKALARLLRPTPIIVLADEIYEYLVYDGAVHLSPGAVEDLRDRTLLVGGFAKAYAMDGWRLGYLAGPRDLMKWAIRVHQYTTVCATTFAQHGAVAAIDGPQDRRVAMIADFGARRAAVHAALDQQRVVTYVPTRGAFYVYVRYARAAPTADELALTLLEERHVAIVPGSAFGPGQSHAFRLSYSCSIADAVEGTRRLTEFIRELTPMSPP